MPSPTQNKGFDTVSQYIAKIDSRSLQNQRDVAEISASTQDLSITGSPTFAGVSVTETGVVLPGYDTVDEPVDSVEGTLIYNTELKAIRFFDGTGWFSVL